MFGRLVVAAGVEFGVGFVRAREYPRRRLVGGSRDRGNQSHE